MVCSNGVEPLLLPMTNVSLAQDGLPARYGIEVRIGSPGQVMAMMPSMSDKDVFLKNVNACNDTVDKQCVGYNGGVYDARASESYAQSSATQWNGSETYETEGAFEYFNDLLKPGLDGTNYGFPMYTNQPGEDPPCPATCFEREQEPWSPIYQGGLGLSINSTFLNAAVESDQAPSRSVGIWPGSASTAESPAQAGLVVVGGYDSSRVRENFTRFWYDDDCPTCINIESMTFDYDGQSTSLLDLDEPRRAMLNPFWTNLMVPTSMLTRFMNITDSNFAHGPGMHWARDETPRGNIAVTLEGGYRTVIPPEQFFYQLETYAEDGSIEPMSDELTWARMDNFTGDDIPQWGMPFLTMNYLYVDHDRKEFKLAPAVQGPVSDTSPVIEAICPDKSGGSSFSTGAIAGSVVGGVLGLVIINVALVWFCGRNKRAARKTPTSPTSSLGAKSVGKARTAELSRESEKGELAGTSVAPSAEMASPEQTKGMNPGAQEMAGTMPQKRAVELGTGQEAAEMSADQKDSTL
jgi:hypothetical protein